MPPGLTSAALDGLADLSAAAAAALALASTARGGADGRLGPGASKQLQAALAPLAAKAVQASHRGERPGCPPGSAPSWPTCSPGFFLA